MEGFKLRNSFKALFALMMSTFITVPMKDCPQVPRYHHRTPHLQIIPVLQITLKLSTLLVTVLLGSSYTLNSRDEGMKFVEAL